LVQDTGQKPLLTWHPLKTLGRSVRTGITTRKKRAEAENPCRLDE
jgi:hypothetical protein